MTKKALASPDVAETLYATEAKATVNDDPLLCPECGQTPTLTKKGWRCGNCFSSGRVLADGYLAVTQRYLGLHLGQNAA